jgi:prevent-host-death family protein
MTVTASKLRANVYQILDSVLETGAPVEVVRKGRILRIVADTPSSKLARLKKRDCIRGNLDDLVEIDWSKEWIPHL